MKSLSSRKKHEKGQGLVEYALILVLVAIVVIGGMTVLGPSIGNVFSSINNSVTTAGAGGGGDCAALYQAWADTVNKEDPNATDQNTYFAARDKYNEAGCSK